MARQTRAFCLLAVLACAPSGTFAVDLTSAYTDKELLFWQPRYEVTTVQLYRALLGQMIGQPAALTDVQRQQLGSVKLRFPLPSEQVGSEASFRGDPLMFYSRLDPPEVTLPALSLKFFSDVCLAYEWLDQNGYEMASPTIYMKIVKYNSPVRFREGRYPPLLGAVGIPDDARKNGDIEQRYFVAFNHLRTFLLLHELGHIYHRHSNSTKGRQAQEEEADMFAFEALLRLQTPPVGAALYFTAAANLQLNRADFRSEARWKEYLRNLSHPANELRLQHASDYIRRNARGFAGGKAATAETEAAVQQITDSLAKLAKLTADPEFEMVAPKSRLVDLSPLVPRKRKSNSQSGAKR
jgi:hypothetical protein